MSDADRQNAINRDNAMRDVIREIRDLLVEIRDALRVSSDSP